MEEHQHNYEYPSTSLIDTELKHFPMSPWAPPERTEGSTNCYGRPSVATLPTPGNFSRGGIPVSKPVATYPPNFLANASNLQMLQSNVFNNHYQVIHSNNYN